MQTEDGDEKKYELLVKRDQDMQQFMDKFDEVRTHKRGTGLTHQLLLSFLL
jgi:uncharacterized protein with gpF-like domain